MGIFVVLIISCTSMLNRSGSTTSSTPFDLRDSPSTLSEDEWVHRESLKYMSESDYKNAEEFRRNWNNRGLTDGQIKAAIDSELRRRGESHIKHRGTDESDILRRPCVLAKRHPNGMGRLPRHRELSGCPSGYMPQFDSDFHSPNLRSKI